MATLQPVSIGQKSVWLKEVAKMIPQSLAGNQAAVEWNLQEIEIKNLKKQIKNPGRYIGEGSHHGGNIYTLQISSLVYYKQNK